MSDQHELRPGVRPPRPRRRSVAVGGIVLALVVIAAVAWVGIRGVLAKQDLEDSVQSVTTLKADLLSGDEHGASSAASDLERSAARARSMTGDPVWAVMEHVPFVGPNLTAVREVSEVVHDVSRNAVRPAVDVMGKLDVKAFKPTGGRIDLTPLVRAQPRVERAARTLITAQHDADRIDTRHTVSPVASAVDRLRSSLTGVAAQAATAENVVSLAPAMLGHDGPRHYLVLFQNNAELRAGGGNPGALALLTIDDGRISLERQASTADFTQADRPVLPLDDDTQGLYGSITGRYIQDVTLTPRFETSAKLARAMWVQRFGGQVDGVLSIDPVTLGYLLKATGPVSLATGDQLTADNAVQLLLSDAYTRYPDPRAQDAFFASAASAVFTKVSQGGFDPHAFVTALTTGVDQGRVKLWSARTGEQARLDGTAIAGGLPVSDGGTQRFGVYLNDGTGAKMDYYLEKTVAVGSQVCRRDGRPTWTVEVTLKNVAPADAATSLSSYVTGGGLFGVAPGAIRTNVAIYAPSSGVYLGASQDGKVVAPQTAKDGKYPVVQLPTTLSPGKSTTVRVRFLGDAKHASTPVDAIATPGVHESVTSPVENSCESEVD